MTKDGDLVFTDGVIDEKDLTHFRLLRLFGRIYYYIKFILKNNKIYRATDGLPVYM